jgi:hypothetical protein
LVAVWSEETKNMVVGFVNLVSSTILASFTLFLHKNWVHVGIETIHILEVKERKRNKQKKRRRNIKGGLDSWKEKGRRLVSGLFVLQDSEKCCKIWLKFGVVSTGMKIMLVEWWVSLINCLSTQIFSCLLGFFYQPTLIA